MMCESAIDCLSHYDLFRQSYVDVASHTRYISTGGGWSPKTPALLKKAVEDHPGSFVVLSFDNDEQGREYTADAAALLEKLVKERGQVLRVRVPAQHKDWNEQLVSERDSVTCRWL